VGLMRPVALAGGARLGSQRLRSNGSIRGEDRHATAGQLGCLDALGRINARLDEASRLSLVSADSRQRPVFISGDLR